MSIREVIRIPGGRMGPAGVGITAAEKAALAPKASPTFTGTATIPTAAVTTLNVSGTASLDGTVNIGNASNDKHTLTGQLNTAGSAPTIAAGASAGTGATASMLYGNDNAGAFQVNTGTGAGTGVIATITFNVVRSSANYSVILFPRESDASDIGGKIYCRDSDRTTALFKVLASAAPTSSTTYAWDYIIIG